MIKLINGRGQLGTSLNALVKAYKGTEVIYIYHTWNFIDKRQHIQEEEYNKFKKFVNEHKDKKIVFISTRSNNGDNYVKYKLLSEAYLLENCKTFKNWV